MADLKGVMSELELMNDRNAREEEVEQMAMAMERAKKVQSTVDGSG